MTFCTSIYGLHLRLNELVPGISVHEHQPTSTDIDVHFGSMPDWFDPRRLKREKWYASTDGEGEEPRLVVWYLPEEDHYHVRYADDTQFLIDRQGTKIWATWPSDTLTVEDTATYLLGPMMGFVLLLRGCTSLHASAIAIGEKAVAIVGPAGSGKSTTAAVFADFGYEILAEDVVTLQDCDNYFLVQPAYPCIRLWPSSVRALYGDDADLPKLTPTWDKRYLDLARERYRFATAPLPLAAIYLLDGRNEEPSSPSVREIRLSEALVSLVANTYTAYLMTNEMRAKQFELLNRLVRIVPIQKLVPHVDPANIRLLCETIINHYASLDSKNSSETQEQVLHV